MIGIPGLRNGVFGVPPSCTAPPQQGFFYHVTSLLQVTYDPMELTEGQILEVVEDAGFEAAVLQDTGSGSVLQVRSTASHLPSPPPTHDVGGWAKHTVDCMRVNRRKPIDKTANEAVHRRLSYQLLRGGSAT